MVPQIFSLGLFASFCGRNHLFGHFSGVEFFVRAAVVKRGVERVGLSMDSFAHNSLPYGRHSTRANDRLCRSNTRSGFLFWRGRIPVAFVKEVAHNSIL